MAHLRADDGQRARGDLAIRAIVVSIDEDALTSFADAYSRKIAYAKISKLVIDSSIK